MSKATSIKRGAQELLRRPTLTSPDVKTEKLTTKKPRTLKKQSGTAAGAMTAESAAATLSKKKVSAAARKSSAQEAASRVKREAPKHWKEVLHIIQEQSEERDTTAEDAVGCAVRLGSLQSRRELEVKASL